MKTFPKRVLFSATGISIAVITCFCAPKASAASQTWGANANTAWLTPGNWAGAAIPGVQGVVTVNNDVATWTSAATATTFGINMNTATGGFNVGAIATDSSRSINTSVGDSSATPGALRLYGATVNGVPDVVLRNAGSGLLTIQILQTGPMTNLVMSDVTANKVYIDSTGGITISANITGNSLSLAGAGTGLLTLSGTNSFAGGFTINPGYIVQANDNPTPFGSGTLTLNGGIFQRGAQNFTPSRANAYTNPVTITANSTMQTTATSTRTIHFDNVFTATPGTTLLVTNVAASGNATNHFRLYAGGLNYAGNIILGGGPLTANTNRIFLELYNTNNPLGGSDQTFTGLISGNGTVYKNLEGSNPGGSVILSNANTYVGGTEIRGGFFGLGANNALGFGNVTIGWDPNPLGLYAVDAARTLTNDIISDVNNTVSLSSALGSTNLQIKGSQNLTLAGRILIHTNVMQFTISNTALTTFSGIVTNAGANSLGITKSGPGTLVLSGTSTYTGTTTVGAGTLALSGTGSINRSTNIVIAAGATLDVSALNTTLALASSQAFKATSANGASATVIASGTVGLTLGSTSPLVLAYSNGIPSLAVTGGALTLAGGESVIVTVANGGAGLAGGIYKLISASAGGSVAGAAPTSLTVNGDGLAGPSAFLTISNSELYLVVVTPTTLILSNPQNPAGYLTPLTFTALIVPTNATGSVTFFAGATPFSTNSLTLGITTSGAISTLPRGTTVITAIYGGDTFYAPSTNTLSQVVTNHPPVAGNATYTFPAGVSFKILITTLLGNASDVDPDTITLTSTTTSTNGTTLTTGSGYLIYPNPLTANDQFTYTVGDGAGGSATGTVNIIAQAGSGGQSTSITVSGSSATVSFAGIPGYTYNVQRSTNLVDWATLITTNAPTGGLFDFTDDFSDLGAPPASAYYQLIWVP